MADMPEFYVDSLSPLKVRKRPAFGAMGFVVCTCDEDVDGAAEEIVKALNDMPKALALLVEIAGEIRAGADPQGLADKIEEWVVEQS